MIDLHPLRKFRVPIIAECISPDIFQGKNRKEIEGLKIWEGNKQKRLRELFKVEENRKEQQQEETTITIHGDVSKVRRVGAYMTHGELSINGNVGMHVGEEMKGGKITVHGNVGGWAGSAMKGGTIEIHGNVSHYLAAPYRGSSKGIHGGRIIVHGNVGNEAGAYMRKGLIKIYGGAGQFAGLRMHGGTIYIQKDCEGRVGASMTGGKIIMGGFVESVLPTFTIESIKEKVKIEENEIVKGPLYLFLGDLTENGKGRLFVSREKNPQLSNYERLL